MKIHFSIVLMLACSFALASPAAAVDWVEVGDAGPVLTSAQIIDVPVLDSITGTITNSVVDVPINDLSAFGASVADVDLYRITIAYPSEFSAETLNGDSFDQEIEFDAILALFDLNGVALYFNDDEVSGDGNAFLPAGNPLGPLVAGDYYLAIYDDNVSPISALSEAGIIFPSVPFPYTGVFGPTGPGGAAPLIDWFPDAPIISPRSYTILLTGVPEPGTNVALAVGLMGIAGLEGRRR